MQVILIYSGLIINIIGALLLAYFAIKAIPKFKEAQNMPMRLKELKASRSRQRTIAFAVMFAGTFIAMVGCFI